MLHLSTTKNDSFFTVFIKIRGKFWIDSVTVTVTCPITSLDHKLTNIESGIRNNFKAQKVKKLILEIWFPVFQLFLSF